MASRDDGPGLGTVILVSLLTSGLVAAGVSYGMIVGLRPDVEVPLVTGITVEEARGMLDARGLRLVDRGERHDDTVPIDLVVEQRPGNGSIVPFGSEVTVLRSLGPDVVEVPNILGLTRAAATTRLESVGLRASGEIHEGGTGEPGTVSRTDPSPGDSIPRDSEVFLMTVPERTTVAVPDLVGMGSRAARDAITAAGLVVGTTRHGFDDVRSPYTVLSQSPAAGTEVEPGYAVELTINDE
jgi:serine/threonine-protein kinase